MAPFQTIFSPRMFESSDLGSKATKQRIGECMTMSPGRRLETISK
jgi:hypothetical protein